MADDFEPVADHRVKRLGRVHEFVGRIGAEGVIRHFWFQPGRRITPSANPPTVAARCVASRANQIRLRSLRQINPTGKSLLIFRNQVKPGNQKYSASPAGQISGMNMPVSPDERGVAHVTNARWDAVDA
jgi:hypothetical protein